jgi:hypothetical protein
VEIFKFQGGQIKIDLHKLEQMQKSLALRYAAQVGILGSKAQDRKETVEIKSGKNQGKHKAGKGASAKTNAEIGLDHEKGVKSRRLPRRSFLEMPLTTKRMELKAVKSALWRAFTAGKGTIGDAYLKLGIAAEVVIQNAFETAGFGQWPPLKPRTIAQKQSSAILIDTAQLRRSIDSRVVSK